MYNKFWAALAAPLAALGAALEDGHIDGPEAFTIVSALAAAVGVYAVRNKPADG